MENIHHTDWKIFSCDGVFEPPMISSQAPLTPDMHAYLQSTVSFPGFSPPESKGRPAVGVSIGRVFVSCTRKVFEDEAFLSRKPEEFFNNLLSAIEEVSMEAERSLLLRWISTSQDTVLNHFTNEKNNKNNHSRTGNALMSLLMLDLLSFYDQTREETD